MRGPASGVIALAMLAAPAALAQDGGALARAMVGQWELATAERGKTCVLTLATEPGRQRHADRA